MRSPEVVVDSLWSRVERIPTAGIVAVFALWVGLPLAGTVTATGLLADGALVALSALGLLAGGAWGLRLRQVARLPLEISPVLLTGEVDGAPVWRVWVRLGRGRPLRQVRTQVRFEGEEESVQLRPVLSEAPLLFGPWTIAVADRDRAVRVPGCLVVEVCSQERGQTWQQSPSFDIESARTGHFGPGFCVDRGKLRFEPDSWDEILEDPC